MAYKLDSVSLRMNNSEEEMNKLAQLWTDVQTGKLPLMFDSDGKFAEGLSPISIYSNYEDDINGAYDLTIMTVGPEFFQMLEQEAAKGVFKNMTPHPIPTTSRPAPPTHGSRSGMISRTERFSACLRKTSKAPFRPLIRRTERPTAICIFPSKSRADKESTSQMITINRKGKQ